MKLEINFGRDEIINAFRKDELKECELVNSFSYDDQIEMMHYMAPNNEFAHVIDLMSDTFNEFGNEGLQEIIKYWTQWLAKKRKAKPLKHFKVTKTQLFEIFVEAEDESDAIDLCNLLGTSKFMPDEDNYQTIEEFSAERCKNLMVTVHKREE